MFRRRASFRSGRRGSMGGASVGIFFEKHPLKGECGVLSLSEWFLNQGWVILAKSRTRASKYVHLKIPEPITRAQNTFKVFYFHRKLVCVLLTIRCKIALPKKYYKPLQVIYLQGIFCIGRKLIRACIQIECTMACAKIMKVFHLIKILAQEIDLYSVDDNVQNSITEKVLRNLASNSTAVVARPNTAERAEAKPRLSE